MKVAALALIILSLASVGCTTTRQAERDAVQLQVWAGQADDQISNVNQLIYSRNKMLNAARQAGGDRKRGDEIQAELYRLRAIRRYLEDDVRRIRRRFKKT